MEALRRSELTDHKYFWRLFYWDDMGVKVKASSIKTLVVDTKPAKLEIFLPRKRARTKNEFIMVKGKTEEGSTVEVNGERAIIYLDGNFVIYSRPASGETFSQSWHGREQEM